MDQEKVDQENVDDKKSRTSGPDTITDYVVGQDNVQTMGLDVHNPVFAIAAVLIIAFVVFTIAFREQAAEIFTTLRPWLTTRFDWVFVISANLFLLFSISLIFSPWAKIKIGGRDAKPQYSYASWFAMMFAAGVGIGLMFYGVLEPVNNFLNPPLGYSATDPHIRQIAMAATIFHWALHPWGIYVVVGLSLALFSYNKGLPLTIRSGFYPILGERVWGWPGHVIDVLAVLATLFGIATSLGLGAGQAAAGLHYLYGVPGSVTTKIVLIVIITAIALISVLRGMDSGVKRLSEINLVMAGVLCLLIVLLGSSGEIVRGFFSNIVSYLQYLPALSNWVDREDTAFYHGWTTFYWSWWIAWSPFVGMFIARVSLGRTVREFICCSLLIPSLVSILWMTTFGDSAIDQYLTSGYDGVFEAVRNSQLETSLFKFLEQFPMSGVLSGLALVLIIIFFVTSMDSGSLVIDTITAGGKIDAPLPQRAFWCCFEGLVAIALLLGGGLASLQALSLASAFPFTLLMLLMCYGIIKGLQSEPR